MKAIHVYFFTSIARQLVFYINYPFRIAFIIRLMQFHDYGGLTSSAALLEIQITNNCSDSHPWFCYIGRFSILSLPKE